MSARKAHNTGRNHIVNVRDYFASLGHDRAQNMIDQIVYSHEGPGSRAQMFAAPSMRLGAGFMNPMAGAPPGAQPGYPPFPSQGAGGPPPFRPPFPPAGAVGGAHPPPFPQATGAPPFPPSGMPPFAPGGQQQPGGPPPPPQSFTPQQGPPPSGNPGIHPDRLRMLGA